MMIRDANFFFFAAKVTVVFVVFYKHFTVKAFVSTTSSSRSHSPAISTISASCVESNRNGNIQLFAGMGMGMGATKSKKKKGGKNKKKDGGMASSSSSTPFDVNSSLIRLEKNYDDLMRDGAKKLKKEEEAEESFSSYRSGEIEMITSEYVIAARSSSPKKASSMISDWVPIAQLCLKRPETEYHDGASDAMVQTAISFYCRELSHLAIAGAPVFSTVARNDLQYSVEAVDSYYKFVYEDVVEGNASKQPGQAMTKAEARKTLGLESDGNASEGPSKSDIKQAYRRLSFELHPDRFEGTEEECEKAAHRFGRVQLANDTLSSGVREEGVSWYESLGGKERTGFVGPVNLLPLGVAQETMKRHKAEGGMCGFDPAVVQSFVARHQGSA